MDVIAADRTRHLRQHFSFWIDVVFMSFREVSLQLPSEIRNRAAKVLHEAEDEMMYAGRGVAGQIDMLVVVGRKAARST